MTRIEIFVDELRLAGFDPRHRHRVADALAREIEERATRENVLWLLRGAGDMEVLRARDVALPRGMPAARPEAVARGVGRSIVDGLAGRGGERRS